MVRRRRVAIQYRRKSRLKPAPSTYIRNIEEGTTDSAGYYVGTALIPARSGIGLNCGRG
jgi:hypothetical protein